MVEMFQLFRAASNDPLTFLTLLYQHFFLSQFLIELQFSSVKHCYFVYAQICLSFVTSVVYFRKTLLFNKKSTASCIENCLLHILHLSIRMSIRIGNDRCAHLLIYPSIHNIHFEMKLLYLIYAKLKYFLLDRNTMQKCSK